MHENRVLRREQRGGKRDEVVLQLETELVAKESERAEMEEQLSSAFSGVIAEAHARIGQLTSERDKLLVQLDLNISGNNIGDEGAKHLRDGLAYQALTEKNLELCIRSIKY